MILPDDKRNAIQALQRAIEILQCIPEKKNCEVCKHYDQRHCVLNDYKIIPDYIHNTGCEVWEFDFEMPPF